MGRDEDQADKDINDANRYGGTPGDRFARALGGSDPVRHRKSSGCLVLVGMLAAAAVTGAGAARWL